MKNYIVPGLALVLGLGAFFWLEIEVLPKTARSQVRDPREVRLVGELNAGRIGGVKGPALAKIIESKTLEVDAHKQMQFALAQLSRLLALVLLATGSIDLYSIVWLKRKAQSSEPA